jgi:hypothetical protein
MSLYKFLLDGIEVSDPVGWEELTTTIRRDDIFNAVLVFQDGELAFTGDGYQYLYDKLQDSFCNVVTIEVFDKCGTDDWISIIKGNIFVSDARFNEKECQCFVKMEDNSFYAKINNNKNIRTSPFTDRSKNGVAITISPTYLLDIYNVSNVLAVSDVETVRVYDAFRFLVDFMTDGTVQFQSTSFDVGGDWEGLCIVTGFRIRTGTATDAFTQFSFQDLYNEIKSRIPIGMKIIDPYNNPTLVIDTLDVLYPTTLTDQLDDVYEVVSSVDQNKLYANVALGTGQLDDDIAALFPEDIDFFGFKDEQFFITGNCNLDATLELVNNWILSSNVIQKTLGGDQGQDSSLFLIDSILSTATTGRTDNQDYLQVGDYFFNMDLNNANTIIRYIGFVPNSIASYLDVTGAGTFHAYLPSNITHTATVAPDNDDYNPLALSAEDYDVSGAWNTVTYRFIAPNAGVYTFDSNIKLSTGSGGVGTVFAYFQAYLRVFDSLGNPRVGEYFGSPSVYYGIRMFTPTTFLAPFGIPFIAVGASTTVNFTGSTQVVLRQGDQVLLRFSKSGTTGDVDYTINSGVDNTFLKCDDNTLGGGIFETGNPSEYPVLVHEFDYPLSKSRFENILSDSSGLVGFAMNGQNNRKAWIKELVYNHTTSVARVKLITDKTTQNAS